MQKSFLLFLYIYTFFSLKVNCQNLKLKILGNTPTETKILDSLIYKKDHIDFISIKTETDSIQKQLYFKGYIENNIIELKKNNDSVFTAKYDLKRKFNLIHIYLDRNNIPESVLNKISLKTTDTYLKLRFTEIENTLKFINQEISKNGRPFSKLKLSNIEIKDNKTLSARLDIDSSEEKRTINNITIKGYDKFPKSYLKYFLKIKPSQTFNLTKIKKQTELLQNLKFAQEVKPPEVLFSKDSTTLYLYLKKAQSNSFDGFLGFGTNEETGKIQFDGYLNLNLTNNLNFGESFKLLYKSDENDQQTFQTNLSLPYLFKSPIGIDLALNIFRKDSTFSTVNQSLKLNYQINSKHKIYAGIIKEESSNLLEQNTVSSILDYTKNFLSLSYEYISPNINNLFPIKTYFYIENNFGNRKDTNETQKQNLINLDTHKIFNLNNRNSIFIRLNSGFINSDSYFDNELLRFGGINSIRGFEENSLFASLYGVINSEYRFQLNNSIYLHSVIDGAYYENKTLNLQEKLISYGFGFGILTKSGLFKLNYANGKSENLPFKFSNSKVHISLTTVF